MLRKEDIIEKLKEAGIRQREVNKAISDAAVKQFAEPDVSAAPQSNLTPTNTPSSG